MLSRTTRRVTFTDEGGRYYAQCVQTLRLVKQAGDEARVTRGAPAGTIRLSCTAAFGVLHVSRLVFAFQDKHPDIAFDLSLSGDRIDLLREGGGYRRSLRSARRQHNEASRVGTKRTSARRGPGLPGSSRKTVIPQDLEGHEGIRMSNVAGSEMLALCGPSGERHIAPFGGRFRVDHGLAAREALIAGRGIAPAHRWFIDDLLTAKRLEEVLPGYRLSSVPLSLLIVPDRANVTRRLPC